MSGSINDQVDCFFKYYDDTQTPYYYHSQSGESTYILPKKGKIYDPATRQLLEVIGEDQSNDSNQKIDEKISNDSSSSSSEKDNDNQEKENSDNNKSDDDDNDNDNEDKQTKPRNIKLQGQQSYPFSLHPSKKSMDKNLDLDLSDEVVHVKENAKDDSHSTQIKVRAFYPAPNNGEAAYLPQDLKEEIHKFQIVDYAKQFFRTHHKRIFRKTKIDMDKITQFSNKPIETSLTNSEDKKFIKNSVRCFKLILTYTGIIPTKNTDLAAIELVQLLMSNANLRDEVYFQLVKQTRENPNPEWEKKTWDLFLIIATIFPSSRNSEVWIKSHIAQSSQDKDTNCASIIQFTFIRFSSRCAIGKPMNDLPSNYVTIFPQAPDNSTLTFGVSIYEQIWNQRKSHGSCPIPYVEHEIIKQLALKKAGNVEGIFRLPGNMRIVNEMVHEFNKGNNPLENAGVHDLASLLKLWFRDLPDPTIPVSMLGSLSDTYEKKNYFDFIATLPPAHYNVLKYLIGFLQEMSKFEAQTKMNAKNYAIVFAPNIVQPKDITEPFQVSRYSDIAIEFMLTLIEKWDTSDIYPLNID